MDYSSMKTLKLIVSILGWIVGIAATALILGGIGRLIYIEITEPIV